MNSIPTSLWEWLLTLDKESQIGVMVFAVIALLVATIIVCITLYNMHKNRLEDALKRELLERGMNADEIARVVESAQPKDFLDRWVCQGKEKSK